jgi:dihydrofolate reductase
MITLILAMDEEGGIGKNNDLPWPRIKEDMKFFREMTRGSMVIMGRKTFESLGSKPLPNRLNVVLSSRYTEEDEVSIRTDEATNTFLSKACRLDKVMDIAGKMTITDVFVIGGAEIYRQTLPYAQRILITRVPGTHNADTFVQFDLTDWKLESSNEVRVGSTLICTFESYLRLPSFPKA